VTQPGVGTNRYAYSFNDPVNKRDVSGNYTIYVKGTRTKDSELDQGFLEAIGRSFGETVEVLPGRLPNNDAGRQEFAGALNKMISAHPFADGEPLNIVAHSHGGNVVKIYSNLPDARSIDTFVSLATPQRDDYTLNRSIVGNYVHVYSDADGVVPYAGGDSPYGFDSVTANVIFFGYLAPAEIRDDSAYGIDATYYPSSYSGVSGGYNDNIPMTDHGQVASEPVWNSYVVPALPRVIIGGSGH